VVGKIKNTFSAAVKSIGKIWKGLQELSKVPIRFIVNDVINKGLIGTFNGLVAKIPFANDKWKLPTVALPKGFAEGGYTGPGPRDKPAGIVHADEFVSPRRLGVSSKPVTRALWTT